MFIRKYMRGLRIKNHDIIIQYVFDLYCILVVIVFSILLKIHVKK